MNTKRILSLFLALGMLLGLAACGQQPSAAAPTEAPEEYVYAGTFTPVPESPENGLNPLLYTEDGFYAQSWEKIGEREIPEEAVQRYEGEYDIYGTALYFVKLDGSVERLDDFASVPTP